MRTYRRSILFVSVLLLLALPVTKAAQAETVEPPPAERTQTDAVVPAGPTDIAAGAPREEAEPAAPLFEDLLARERLVPLSLHQSRCIALANSLDIELQRYLPRISAAQVLAQQGVFDPYIFFSATYLESTIPLSSMSSVQTGGLSSVEAEQWILSGGLTGVLPSGLLYEASIASEHTPTSTINEAFGTKGQQRFETVISVSQPLLKNFGVDINTTGIRAAERAQEASILQFEQSVIDTLFAVEQAYWNLVFTYENLQVRLDSLRLAMDLLRENRIRLRVGVVAPLAVLQSETGVAFREEEVILSLSLVQRASDNLVSLINLFPHQDNWDVQIFPLDKAAATPPPIYDEGVQIALALRDRPDLRAIIIQREIAELEAKFSKNQLLPALNLNASAGLIGLDSDFDASFSTEADTGIDPALDDLFSGENFEWLIGFTFEVPLGQHFERGQYRAATLQANQLDTTIQNLRLLIAQDVRDALRQISTNWQRVESSRVTTGYRRRSLEAERKRHEVGVTTTFDLLRFENDLAQAQANELNALVEYRVSLSNLLRANGILLQHLGVTVETGP